MNELGLSEEVSGKNELPPVELCDVHEPEVLSRYRRKRAEWLSWYSFVRNDPNTIQGQILGMIFLDLSYRTLTKPRTGFADGSSIAANSAILAGMLDQGYVAVQVLALRRLLDKREDVFSIRRLLDDIRKNRELITREVFVAYDGGPYDPEGWVRLPPIPEMRAFGIDAPAVWKFLRSSERHKMFDKLSGVLPSGRSRRDTIRIGVFEKLYGWLTSTEAQKLIKLSHKFLAHASDLDSRETLIYSGISLKDIEAAQKAIVSVERALTDDILFIGVVREVVPMTPLGFLKGLDSVYAPREAVSEMDSYWDELKSDRNSWARAYEAELYRQ